MTLTQERAEAVGKAITNLVHALNSVTEEELQALIQVGEDKHAIDPMLDPTRYRAEGHGISQGQTVLREMIRFKQAVKGIGYFK